MNQLVAPTNFITSISLRLANMAVRMVFQISSADANSSTSAITSVRGPKKLFSSPSTATASSGVFTSMTLGSWVTRSFRDFNASPLLELTGLSLNEDGMMSGVKASRKVSSAANTFWASAYVHASSQYSTVSISVSCASSWARMNSTSSTEAPCLT